MTKRVMLSEKPVFNDYGIPQNPTSEDLEDAFERYEDKADELEQAEARVSMMRDDLARMKYAIETAWMKVMGWTEKEMRDLRGMIRAKF